MALFLFVSVLQGLSQARGAINCIRVRDKNAATIRPKYAIDLMIILLFCISIPSTEYTLVYVFEDTNLGKQLSHSDKFQRTKPAGGCKHKHCTVNM